MGSAAKKKASSGQTAHQRSEIEAARATALDAACQIQDVPLSLEHEDLADLCSLVADDLRTASERLEALSNEIYAGREALSEAEELVAASKRKPAARGGA